MSISELLRGHKDRWTKKAFARDPEGNAVISNHPKASCWCLLGMVFRCYPLSEVPAVVGRLTEKLPKPFVDLGKFNDDPKTTFEDVEQVVLAAGV